MSPTPTPPALADSVNLDEGRALLEKAITLLPWPTRVTTSKESGEYLTMPGWASFGNNEAAAKLFLMVPALLSAVAALERERDELRRLCGLDCDADPENGHSVISQPDGYQFCHKCGITIKEARRRRAALPARVGRG